MSSYTTLNYFLDDHPHTLFPLSTNKIVIERGHSVISQEIYKNILGDSENNFSFLPQTRCHSIKKGFHLRRTLKLDPVAEFFVYDFVYKSRPKFRPDFNQSRRSFGYRFENGKPIPVNQEYQSFKTRFSDAKSEYKYVMKFDIATYFNSIYHHHLTNWYESLSQNKKSKDTENFGQLFGQFLREIRRGESIDCLPQGIHPCKIIGSEFLKFIDNTAQIESELMLRFMDDFCLFSNDQDKIFHDFLLIQYLLGDKCLSINQEKTFFNETQNYQASVDNQKVSLLRLRRKLREVSDHFEMTEDEELNDDDQEYLLSLVENNDIDESDAELFLVLLRDYQESRFLNIFKSKIDYFLLNFPGLIRNIYNVLMSIEEPEDIVDLFDELIHFLDNSKNATEEQLFWIGKVAEDFLIEEKLKDKSVLSRYSSILIKLYKHTNATKISRAKVLEIPESRFGMDQIRDENVRDGDSHWLSWAAAVGCRKENSASRKKKLRYFSKNSPMNKIIATCLEGEFT